jgi:hypothetical protein
MCLPLFLEIQVTLGYNWEGYIIIRSENVSCNLQYTEAL